MSRRPGKLSTVAYTDVDDSASSLSRVSNTNTTRGSQIELRPVKRRRTGLNSRYDRMIESVYALLPYRKNTSAASHRRVKSSSTSSVSSHDLPKTPMDAYSNLHSGKLGKDFSVLKMKKSSPFLREGSDDYPEPVVSAKEPKNPLPDWLANTFCSLESDHPLRGLISPGKDTEQESSSLTVEPLHALHKEQVFAFSPFDERTEVPEGTNSPLNSPEDISHPFDIIRPDPNPGTLTLMADVLPFSTPGCFVPVHKSIKNMTVKRTSQEPLIPVTQDMLSRGCDTMHPAPSPSSFLRPYDHMKQQQFRRSLSNRGQDNVSPPDIRNHSTLLGQISQSSRTPNIYATPGPTFACSRPVYFDSPTEDPSSSDPLDPESYELDLHTIDFRWEPFMRSNAVDGYANREVDRVSPAVLGYAIPNQTGDQGEWKSHLHQDPQGYSASDEEHPALQVCAENTNGFYLDDAPETQPSYLSSPTRDHHPNDSGWQSLPIDKGQETGTAIAPGVFVSPLRDRPDSTLLAVYDVVEPHGDEENIDLSKELLAAKQLGVIPPDTQPSTPMRQTRMLPPPTPHKIRLTQLRVPELPFQKPSYKAVSALSLMVPLKTSKRTIFVNDEVNTRLPRGSGNSDDTIESWSESK